jgi:two-component system, cell cycle sensor histidine kinase and response regulator CckA
VSTQAPGGADRAGGGVEVLARTALEFVGLPADADIYLFIAERLQTLVGDALVFVNSCEENSSVLHCRAVVGMGNLVQRSLRLLGRHPLGMQFPLTAEAHASLLAGELELVEGGLKELALGQIPDAVCAALERALRLDDCWSIGFAREGELFANATVLRRSGQEPLDTEVVETFIRQASLALRRKQAEERLRQTEDQLLRSQRLEAVGRLAGGIAHDFNNLLGVILGYGEMMAAEIEPGSSLEQPLHSIQSAAARAADLTRQLLAFSRRQIIEPKIIDLNDVVREMESMLERMIGEMIEVETRLAPDLDPVEADPGQVEQVLMNLVVNAREAMPDGGRLTIETSNVLFDDAYLRSHVDTEPGPHVLLALSDTGQGMDDETRSQVFEPFFTTKESGTGLGLSTVYGIVRQAGGTIWVYSEPGQGTTFKVYLPRASGQPVARAELPSLDGAPRGNETILVAEDEPMLRQLVVRILESAGYQVLQASDGREALGLCETHEGVIHLLVTDLVMPEMGGRELAEYAATLRPDLLTLYSSGYTDDGIVQGGRLEPGLPFIQKPFVASELLARVRALLNR